jgi:hypothetical protein
VPDPALLTDRGREWLDDMPLPLRDDPDAQAVVHCYAKESERQQETLDRVLRQMFPQLADALGLPIWEFLLRITIEPAGWTVQQRVDAVVVILRKLKKTPTGAVWQQRVTDLVGSGWTYREHDPTGAEPQPPPYTILIELSVPANTALYALTERVLRVITPAHLDLVVTPSGGFVLDQSQLDQQALTE